MSLFGQTEEKDGTDCNKKISFDPKVGLAAAQVAGSGFGGAGAQRRFPHAGGNPVWAQIQDCLLAPHHTEALMSSPSLPCCQLY